MFDDLIQTDRRPRYLGIADAIVAAVRAGRIQVGDKLPTQREMARQLNTAVATVGRAYSELESRGVIVSHVGRGTFIAAREPRPHARMRDAIDLAQHRVPVPPYCDRLSETVRTIATEPEAARALFAHAGQQGHEAHRGTWAKWLGRFGLSIGPEQVLLTNGGQHGQVAAISTLTRQNDLIATEALTDPKMKAVASYLDRRLAPIAMDEQGAQPDALARLCRKEPIRAIYLTPRFQNPTNARLPLERREAIVAIAREFDLPIIESDIYGTLIEDETPPISALAPERTHYVTSLGKIVGPGVKVGCVVSPPAAIGHTQAGVAMSTGSATPLPAAVACRWIEDGTIDEMIRWQRAENRRRLGQIEVRTTFDAARSNPESPHVWLPLPEPWRADEFVAAAAAAGISIAPTHSFVVGRAEPPHAVRFCVGAALDFAELEIAIERLDQLLRSPPRANTAIA